MWGFDSGKEELMDEYHLGGNFKHHIYGGYAQ